MGRVAEDLSGRRFGRLTVIKREVKSNVKNKKPYWLCRCDCGNKKIIKATELKNGKTQSCGCLKIEKIKESNTKHGMKGTRFYTIWQDMKARCNYVKNDNYKYYGARGIKVCEEWNLFDNFMNDMYDSYLEFERINGKDSATLDRIDFNKGYYKDNCKWSTVLEQNRNRRNNTRVIVEDKEFSTINELAEYYGLNKETVRYRYKNGKRGKELIKPTI